MRLVLRPVQTIFSPEKPVIRDYFDEKGVLLLSKGQNPRSLADTLNSRQVYTLHYELTNNLDPVSSYDICPKNLVASERIYPWIQKIYVQAELIEAGLFSSGILFVNQLIQELEEHPLIAGDLEALRSYDKYTYMHSINVSLLSYAIGTVMKYTGEKLRHLVIGALLHDIGKLTVPVSIINKPMALSDEEYHIMQTHPTRGVQRSSDFFLPRSVLTAILEHHERWNGSGYPYGLCKNAIHPYSQIVAVADVFDALITDRPYRPGIPPYHAIEMLLKGSGTNFSPDVITAFLDMIQIYPENSLVTLNSGESGIVIEYSLPHPTRPIIRILYDSSGRPVEREQVIDLNQDPQHYIDVVHYAWVS